LRTNGEARDLVFYFIITQIAGILRALADHLDQLDGWTYPR